MNPDPYVELKGNTADPVLLLHGLGCNGAVWDCLVALLLKHGFGTIVPDFSGHGRSAWSSHYSLEQQAAAIRRLGRNARELPNELDIENVAEEIEGVGRSELAAVESYLELIFVHLIRLVVEPDSTSVRHWRGEIAAFHANARRRYSPSMRQRIDINADLHFNEHFRLFTQVISGYDWGSNTPAPPVDQDPAALQQAFLDFRTDNSSAADPEYLVVRAGRFAMTYGSGRLIATRQAPNIPFKFDGFEVIGAAHDAKIYAFLTNPAREKKNAFDDDFPHQLLGGVYATTPLLSSALGLRADIYYLYYQNDSVHYANGTGPEVRNTFGTRLFGKINGFDYDIEPIIQTGHFAGREIFAWTVGSTVGYRFEESPLKPRLGADFDVVSGDSGTGHFGTFNPLFFKSGYFDDASLIRPSNIIDIHPTLQLQAPHALLVTLGSDVIWRYTRRDGIYAPPGNLELPAGGAGRYLATTGEVSVQWQLSRHLSWIGSYTRFFTGNYVQSAKGHDVDFFGTWATFTF